MTRARTTAGQAQVGDVMTTDVVTVSAETPLTDVIAMMRHHAVGCLPVVDDERRVLGIVTDTDLIVRKGFAPLPAAPCPLLDEMMRAHRNRWRHKAGGVAARDVMTTPVSTASPDEPLRMATARMITMSFRRLPVVGADGRLVGVLSQRDVLDELAESDGNLLSPET